MILCLRRSVFAALALVAGCGGTNARPASAEPPPSPEGGAVVEAAAPVERPFAATPLEAQTMIQARIEDRIKPMWHCVDDYRKRVGDPHRPVAVNIGIDQEGHLIGIAAADPKRGDLDESLKRCLTEALHGAPFPRSHTGVITVKQIFRDTSL